MDFYIEEGLRLPYKDFFVNDRGGAESIYQFGEDVRKASMSYCKNFRTIIDIGAHVGISVLDFAKHFEKVYAFEPMPVHFECLKQNTAHLSNVNLINVALSNITGTVKGGYRSEKNTGTFQILPDDYVSPKYKVRQEYDIECKTLDSFSFDNIDLIKIDVEGRELFTLKGAVNTIKKHKPVLQVEYYAGTGVKSLSRYDNNEYLALIEEINYKPVARLESDTIYVSK